MGTLVLDQGWLDSRRAAAADAPVRPGASAVVEYAVTGGPHGVVVFHVTIEDGRVSSASLGPAEDPDFTMTTPEPDFAAVAAGELDPKVGYMQGRIKVAGNVGRMLSVLPVMGWLAAT